MHVPACAFGLHAVCGVYVSLPAFTCIHACMLRLSGTEARTPLEHHALMDVNVD